MADYTTKQHDTWPPIEAILSDANGPIDLTTATSVKMILKTTVQTTPYLSEICTIVNPVAGRVRYNWAVGDTDTSGEYDGEFEILWSDGSIETVPNTGYFSLEIQPDLG